MCLFFGFSFFKLLAFETNFTSLNTRDKTAAMLMMMAMTPSSCHNCSEDDEGFAAMTMMLSGFHNSKDNTTIALQQQQQCRHWHAAPGVAAAQWWQQRQLPHLQLWLDNDHDGWQQHHQLLFTTWSPFLTLSAYATASVCTASADLLHRCHQ